MAIHIKSATALTQQLIMVRSLCGTMPLACHSSTSRTSRSPDRWTLKP